MATGNANDADFEGIDFDGLTSTKDYINRGSFGAVFGPFTRKNRTFAVKQLLLNQTSSDGDDFNSKVATKKPIWTSLKHKHLIEILYVSWTNKVVYLAMEYASGKSLRNLLDKPDARVHRQINVTNWARQIAEGMLYLHEMNIVHRDLKSNNIVLMDLFESLNAHEEMMLKIIDFDEVQENFGTTTMSLRGTCSHMAPEVLSTERFSKASDVWSFGVLVWEMCTKEHPHKGIGDRTLMQMAMNNQLMLPVPEPTPTAFKKLLHDCWCRETNKRPIFKTIIDHLSSIESSEENLRYKSDPVLFRAVRTKASMEGRTDLIGGMAILGNELFVVIERSPVVEVYDLMELKLIRQWDLKVLIWPMDIVSCNRNKCLYIIDYRGHNGQSKQILRVDPQKSLIHYWSTGEDWGWGLSVTAESNVILTVNQRNKLNEYSPDGQLVRVINLQSDLGICNPWHAIKLTNGHFVVSHGSTKTDLHRVCIVDADGNLKKSFGGECGSTIEQMNRPFYLAVDRNGFVMVSDRDNNRVLLLNSDLKFKREILSKDPGKILLDKLNDRMFVAVNEKHDQRIFIFNCNNFV